MPKNSSCFCFSFFRSKKTAKKNNVQQDRQHGLPAPSDNQTEKIKKNKIIKIITNVKNEEIQFKDFMETDDDRITYKYLCPICLRNFNRSLQSSCCKNYICHFCANDYETILVSKDSAIIKCHYCNTENFYLHDVDLNEKVKRYTDSSQSFFSPNQGTQTMKGLSSQNRFFQAMDNFKKNEITANNSDSHQNEANQEEINNENNDPNFVSPKCAEKFYKSEGFKEKVINHQNENLFALSDNCQYKSLSKFYNPNAIFSDKKCHRAFDDHTNLNESNKKTSEKNEIPCNKDDGQFFATIGENLESLKMANNFMKPENSAEKFDKEASFFENLIYSDQNKLFFYKSLNAEWKQNLDENNNEEKPKEIIVKEFCKSL